MFTTLKLQLHNVISLAHYLLIRPANKLSTLGERAVTMKSSCSGEGVHKQVTEIPSERKDNRLTERQELTA